jgi:carbon storage regulator
MLALTRKIDQRIQIGPDVYVTILHVRGKQVRLGIEAPRQVKVVRMEVAREDESVVAPSASRLFAATNGQHAGASPIAAKRRPASRRPRSSNPGEHAFISGRQPLAAKLHARRAPNTAMVAAV